MTIGHQFPMLHLSIDNSVRDDGLSKTDDAQSMFELPGLKKRSHGGDAYYRCPLYVNIKKNRVANNGGAEGQVITHIPIPIYEKPASFWTKRNICLLCYNETQVS